MHSFYGKSFEHEVKSNQMLNCTFLSNLLLLVRLYIDKDPIMFIDFVDWLTSYCWRKSFFFFFFVHAPHVFSHFWHDYLVFVVYVLCA